jgi:endonuclease YncB( thermonuclease family)
MRYLVKLTGEIHLSQFWPQGQADADTSKVNIHVGNSPFSVSNESDQVFQSADFLNNAIVTGQHGRKPVVTQLKNGEQYVKVRLQGIDAPELHYKASNLTRSESETLADDVVSAYKAEARIQYRQPFAETATKLLARRLGQVAPAVIQCEVRTWVENPPDIFDVYGRFVGDLFVRRGQEININRWLCRNGLAYPSFYSSMSAEEIEALAGDARKARTKKGRTAWSFYSNRMAGFDSSLVYKKQDNGTLDDGNVIYPKLFRRQVTWNARKRAGLTNKSFASYLREIGADRIDPFYSREDFIENGINSSTQQFWNNILTGSELTAEPENFVFIERPSNLVDANNHRISKWP